MRLKVRIHQVGRKPAEFVTQAEKKYTLEDLHALFDAELSINSLMPGIRIHIEELHTQEVKDA